MSKLKENRNIILIAIMCVLLIFASVLVYMGLNGKASFDTRKPVEIINPAEVQNLTEDYYGILVLGSDQGATRTNGGNHTDSVTYLAINKKTQKAYALPIYRDTIVSVVCDGTSKNVNQVYRDNGPECMRESVAALLGVPIDYYAYITSNGFVDILNGIGPITVTPEASYCSKYGNDDQEYCFTEGSTKEMTGNELLAYARFRGNTSGEARANRHVQLLNKFFEKCLGDTKLCGAKVLTGYLSNDIQTDLPFEEVLQLTAPIYLENLGVISGSNFEDASGWHQRMNEDDKQAKIARIQQEIFVS